MSDMPLWGIVLLGLAAWVGISVVLGVLIGRAVRIAEARRSDQEFVRQVSRRGVPAPRLPVQDAWPRPLREGSPPASATAPPAATGDTRPVPAAPPLPAR